MVTELIETTPVDESNKQFDLFRKFITNDPNEVSNTIELWESVPKYFLTPAQVKKLRSNNGLAKPIKFEYESMRMTCRVEISPASIEQPDGSYLSFFPGVSEELIEKVLVKILAEQKQGFHDSATAVTRVFFTLRMIQRELKSRGRERNIAEIKRSIDIMSKCNVNFRREDGITYNGSILENLATVGKDEFLIDNKAQHAAKLPSLITDCIDRLQFRQYNYCRLMACDTQLSRWIYKRLINRYVQADLVTEYNITYSNIKQASKLVQQSRESDNRAKVISALDELVTRGVIRKYTAVETRKGRKVLDVAYTINTSAEFMREQKAANKRKKVDSELSAKQLAIASGRWV